MQKTSPDMQCFQGFGFRALGFYVQGLGFGFRALGFYVPGLEGLRPLTDSLCN